MESGIPELESEDAKEGQFLHALDAHPEYDREILKPNLRDILRISGQLDEQIFHRVRDQFGIPKDEGYSESRERYILVQGNGLSVPGRFDRARYWPACKILCIIDKKFGFKIVTPASANDQLRVYAVGASNEWNAEHIVVAITQPRLSYYERITMAAYSRDDIAAAYSEILSIKQAAQREDAPLVASDEACRYCKAKLVCNKYAEAFGPLSIMPDGTVGQWSKAKILEVVHGLGPEKIMGLLNAISFSDLIKDEVRDIAREMVSEGRLPDYELGKAGSVREIADPKRAISLLQLAGHLTKEEIFDCAKLYIGKLEDRLRDKTRWSEKKAREILEETLSSVIERSEKRSALIRKTK